MFRQKSIQADKSDAGSAIGRYMKKRAYLTLLRECCNIASKLHGGGGGGIREAEIEAEEDVKRQGEFIKCQGKRGGLPW